MKDLTGIPEQPVCRICLESVEDPNFTPCNCSGTQGCVHAHCLETWVQISGSENCELCGTKLQQVPYWQSPLKWGCPAGDEEGNRMAMSLMCILVVVPPIAMFLLVETLSKIAKIRSTGGKVETFLCFRGFVSMVTIVGCIFMYIGNNHVLNDFWRRFVSKNKKMKIVEYTNAQN